LSLRYKRYEVWLDDLTSGDSEKEVMHAPLPYVGGGIRFNLSPYVSFGGELGVMNIAFNDYGLQLKDHMDFHAYAEIRLTAMFAIVGGYRFTKFRISIKKDDIDYSLNEEMQGMFIGVVLMF
jgi:hypothetical protein